jgi:hypothetical protein
VTYWQQRQHMRYYAQVLDCARRHAPGGGSVLDVGGRDCVYVAWFDWFQRKVVLDLKPPPPQPGVETVTGDFLAWQPDVRFDLVLCLQVLEHLADPKPFCRKLLATGRIVIVSVPYRWPQGLCRYHLQDPVDEAKLLGWAGQHALELSTALDGQRARLIAVFDGAVV